VTAAGPLAFGRPRVVVSQCLDLAPVRYDGETIPAPLVRRLAHQAELVAVCPEVGIRLGVPRDPIRLVRLEDDVRLLQPSSGRDLSEDMDGFVRRFLDRVGPVDGFILKSRSPSCGVGDVKLHAAPEGDAVAGMTSGRFASAVLARFPASPTTDELGLADARRRHHWLTRVFTRATLREAVASGEEGALPEFHATHRLLLLTHDPAAADLQRLTGRGDAGRSADVARAYAEGVDAVLRRPPDPSRRQALLERWTMELGEDAPEVRRCRQPYPAALMAAGPAA
jgi:uncharacterized protein YbbK (DUF523 family)